MKRSHGIAIGALAIIALSVAILQVIGSIFVQRPVQRRSLTMEDINRLAKELAAPEAGDTRQWASEPAEGTSPPESVREPLPRRLERAATAEERAEHFRNRNFLRFAASLVYTNPAFDAVCRLAGHRDVSAFLRGQVMIRNGDWDGARSCFTTVLEETQDPFARHAAFLQLAWVEDDPELAARCLEIACHDDANLQNGVLLSASELARTTGSDALAGHYRTRYENFFLPRPTP